MKIFNSVLTTIFLLLSSYTAAQADETITLVIKNKAFEPSSIVIPANKRIKIMVDNTDTLPAEVESHDAGIEKVVPGGTKLPLYVGPLKAGTYSFFNEFFPSSKGQFVVK